MTKYTLNGRELLTIVFTLNLDVPTYDVEAKCAFPATWTDLEWTVDGGNNWTEYNNDQYVLAGTRYNEIDTAIQFRGRPPLMAATEYTLDLTVKSRDLEPEGAQITVYMDVLLNPELSLDRDNYLPGMTLTATLQLNPDASAENILIRADMPESLEDLQYSLDNGETWADYENNEYFPHPVTPLYGINKQVQFRGTVVAVPETNLTVTSFTKSITDDIEIEIAQVSIGQVLAPVPHCDDSRCEWIFSDLRVTPTIAFGTRIEWTLHPNFTDPGPYTFRLQVGRTGLRGADDWQLVGFSAENTFYMLDDTQRAYGKTNWTHYRIYLSTPQGDYFSPPVRADGDLSLTDRREWRTVIKTWQTLFRLRTGQDGYLLKRRLFGQPCTENCIDYLTREVSDPECPVCYGTGFLRGYYEPVTCVYASLDPRVSHNERDSGQARGTIDDALRVKATMLGVPQVFENDVWVDKQTDRRWYIHQIQNRVEIRGVAAVIDCEFRLAPFTDPIYRFEIADQIPQ